MKLFRSLSLTCWCFASCLLALPRATAGDATRAESVVVESIQRLTGPDEAAHELARKAIVDLAEEVVRGDDDAGRRAVAKAFERALRGAYPARVKLAFLSGVQRVGKWEVVSTVGGLLNNPQEDPAVREAALSALEANPAVGAKKELRKAAKTTSGDLRLGVIRVLGSRRDPLSAGILMEAAREEDPAVQLAALEALAEIGEISAVPIAEAALRTYEGDRLEVARRAYVRYGDSLVRNSERGQARRIYLRALELGPEHRAAALVGLAKANLQGEVGTVVEALGDEDERVRAAASKALALYKSPAVVDALLLRLEAETAAETRLALLEVLAARTATPKARTGVVKALLEESDEAVQVRVLGLLSGDRSGAVPAELIAFLLRQVGAEGALAEASERFLIEVVASNVDDALNREATRARVRLEALERVLAGRSTAPPEVERTPNE